MGTILGVHSLPGFREGGGAMSVASALSLMIQFGSFTVALVSLVVAVVLAVKRK